jgi:hypothetical protein
VGPPQLPQAIVAPRLPNKTGNVPESPAVRPIQPRLQQPAVLAATAEKTLPSEQLALTATENLRQKVRMELAQRAAERRAAR